MFRPCLLEHTADMRSLGCSPISPRRARLRVNHDPRPERWTDRCTEQTPKSQVEDTLRHLGGAVEGLTLGQGPVNFLLTRKDSTGDSR